MQIVFGGSTVVAGLVALLTGLYGLRRTREILTRGTAAVALVKRGPAGSERPLLQFETEDGRVMEMISPVPLDAGASVVLLYDPRDPRDVALPAHRRTAPDLGFVLAGSIACVIGVVLMTLAL